MIQTDHIKTLRELLAKATARPWHALVDSYDVDDYHTAYYAMIEQVDGDPILFGPEGGDQPEEHDTELAAAAVNSLELLLDTTEFLSKLLSDVQTVLKVADAERLRETYDEQAEAEKWKAEGDMYGWNFHQGVAAGCTTASIIFYRVRRLLEERLTGVYARPFEPRLPAEMQDCTILLKQCELGHAWLTATNWVQHSCPTCEIERLRVKAK